MPNDDPRDGFSYPTLTLMMDFYILCLPVSAFITLANGLDQDPQKGAVWIWVHIVCNIGYEGTKANESR